MSREGNTFKDVDVIVDDLEDGVVQLGENIHPHGLPSSKNVSEYTSGEDENDEEEHDGLMITGNRNGEYTGVRTNNNNKKYPLRQSGCCSRYVLCQTVLLLIALCVVGMFGFYMGKQQAQQLASQSGPSSWFEPPKSSNNNVVVDDTSTVVVSNMDSKTYSELLQEANLLKSNSIHKQHTIRYNPSAVLSTSVVANNPFQWDNAESTPNVITPPRVVEKDSPTKTKKNSLPRLSGYFTHPHLVNNQLVFCSEGDAYVTHLSFSNDDAEDDDSVTKSYSAMKLTTSIGNVLDPKWHPTLPMFAYTATYSGRRDVYLMDLRAGTTQTSNKTPMRLTYWDKGLGGVSGLIGWISNDTGKDGVSSYSLLFRAMSNEVSLPDYRLYMIHLDNSHSNGDNTHSLMEIEPVPLAQATDAARWNQCWYFVRYKQSSNTIRYVGGTAENLWKYCDNENSSQPLFHDDDYKGTSKDPQLYRPNSKHSSPQPYLFFLSDRGLDKESKWIPDRMNIWAIKLTQQNKNAPSLSTSDLSQITDTGCDFEGRTIREYSVDAVTGNIVVRIGADLYIMSQEAIQDKLNNGTGKDIRFRDRRRFLEETDHRDSKEEGKQDGDSQKVSVEVDSPLEANENNENQVDNIEEIKSTGDDKSQEESNVDDFSVALDDKSNETTSMPIVPITITTTESPSSSLSKIGDEEVFLDNNVTQIDNTTNVTEAPRFYYNYESPELVTRSVNDADVVDHVSGHSSDLKLLSISVISDFYNLQERIVPVDVVKHFTFGDVFDTISQTTKMLLTLRGHLWVAPVVPDGLPPYAESGKNLPARQYRVAPGAMMGGVTRILAARHVPNPAEDGTSDRRLAVVLATDPLTSTAEHAFYLIEVQPGADPLFVDSDSLPKPFLGGIVSGGSTRNGGLGSVRPETLQVSPCGNRMAWSDTDGRIMVMNLPHYQELHNKSGTAEFVMLPQENELGEPMMGDEVDLTFSPGGRYLVIEHHARNQFQVLSIADLGDPLSEENKIADIAVGRIVQATPSKFNSKSAYWGRSPAEIQDLAVDGKMSQLFGLKDPDDVSTTLYFLSDRDILTDVHNPWGDRQTMPHFKASMGVYAIPLRAKDTDSQSNGQFRGGGGEEVHVQEVIQQKNLLQSLLQKASTATSRRQIRHLQVSLTGVFGVAEKSFNAKSTAIGNRRMNENDDGNEEEEDDHLKVVVFTKDMDVDFGPVDLSFSAQAYRVANIPEGDYLSILSQIPDDGSLVIIERSGEKSSAVPTVFLPDDYPSDRYDSKSFVPTMRKLAAWQLCTSRKYFYLIYAPDGAIRVVPNSLSGLGKLLSDLELDDSVVDRNGLQLSIWPSLEYRQMYDDAWRMLRDYFYDPDMTGIDWPAIHERYLPLVERCTKREELDDALIQMASELSALHVFVYGGEYNSPMHGNKDLKEANEVGSLGAVLKRSPEWSGYMVMSIPMADPDYSRIDQEKTVYSPLSDQTLRMSGQRGLQAGDVIVGVNGESVMRVPDIHMLLRGTAGRSVRLEVLRLASLTSNSTKVEEIDAQSDVEEAPIEPLVTVPLSPDDADDLLYHAWEWKTEQLAQDLATKAGISVGYVHLQDMSGPEAEDAFARGFFPNYHKQGFILDVRHNRGGNIDSWILDVLQRKPWMYWQGRAFNPSNGGLSWDEQYAFRGHIVVLLDEKTSSDGEGVSRGIAELGLGRLIGTRTWGGGIWLASDNHLVDGGIATAPEIGTYNERLEWGLHIEQMGVDPDIVVDNDPHETFTGTDRQLERAIEELKKWLDEEPVVLPAPRDKKRDMTMGDRECKATS